MNYTITFCIKYVVTTTDWREIMKNFHQNCPLFRNLENEDSALAALCARNKNYEKGEFLLHAGEPTREFGILTRGTAHIVREDEEGNPVLVAELGSGAILRTKDLFVKTNRISKPRDRSRRYILNSLLDDEEKSTIFRSSFFKADCF